jgi:hypothetical protein
MAFKHNTSLTSDGVLQQGDYESTSGHLLDNQAEGDLIVADSTTTMTRLGAGAADTVLTSDGTNPSYSKLTTSNLTDATLVTETDTIAGNDNDTTIPTSAAVKDYVDNQVSGTTLTFEDDATVTGSVDLDAANLKVLGGTNVTTNRTAANEITVNLDADISVTSVTASTTVQAQFNQHLLVRLGRCLPQTVQVLTRPSKTLREALTFRRSLRPAHGLSPAGLTW